MRSWRVNENLPCVVARDGRSDHACLQRGAHCHCSRKVLADRAREAATGRAWRAVGGRCTHRFVKRSVALAANHFAVRHVTPFHVPTLRTIRERRTEAPL
jgi:hypothetical protein